IRVGSKLTWVAVIFFTLFILGSFYVYEVNKSAKASISLLGYKNEMSIKLNNELIVVTNPKIELKSDQIYNLVVKQNGYHDFEKDFFLQVYENKIINLNLKKIISTNGSIILITNPPGATVYLDSMEWKQKTPVTISNLESDKEYKIGLFLQKHQFKNFKAKLTANQPQYKISHNFLINSAYLSITTNPIGADIYINNQLMGQSPFQDANIKPNKLLNIQIKKIGYQTKTKSIKLGAGEELTVNFHLNAE
ncbi:hypothetical protein BVY03_05350, partial [bacterium K02(2017)]